MNNEEFTQTSSTGNVSSLPGIGRLLGETFSIYQKKIKVFLILILMLVFLPLIVVGLPVIASIIGLSFFFPDNYSDFSLILILLMVVAFVVMVFISLWISVSLLIAIKEREREVAIKELFSMARHRIASYFWISLLEMLIIFGGFLLFIIPGIIMSIWFSLSLIVFVSEDLKGTKALARSKQLVKGHWWSVFWKFIVFNVIIMAISITVGLIPFIGGFVSMLLVPFSIIFSFLIYENLKKINPVEYSPNIGRT